MAATGVIRKLDEVVVNKIAAGEVIQRPANALKEMIENSLDAKATNIQVIVKSGGIKMLQIQDNGTGIKKEDLDLVCERFATSKLETYEDLASIATYGFRGEALASISHVAHVTITTKTADSKCAYKVQYSDGKPLHCPKPCAGNKGTQILVEDLFYNMNVRRNALKNASEEYAKIAEVVSRYAIHNSGIAFSLKKHGEGSCDVQTLTNATTRENIRSIYGPTVAKELLDFETEDSKLRFKAKGLISNANYSVKKCTFLLFINHRLVESSQMRKAIESVYASYLPKQMHPFLYISLEIVPQNIDVNVHPTKHEVRFLHEAEILEKLQNAVDAKLLGSNASRTFLTQTLLPGTSFAKEDHVKETELSNEPSKEKKVYDYQLVRTDSKEQKLDAFFKPSCSKSREVVVDENCERMFSSSVQPKEKIEERSKDVNSSKAIELKEREEESVNENLSKVSESEETVSAAISEKNISQTSNLVEPMEEENTEKNISKTTKQQELPDRVEVQLTSVTELRQEVMNECHPGLLDIIQNMTFVGAVDHRFALFQHKTKLYIANTHKLSEELFYQLMLKDFENFGVLRLSSPAPIYELAMLGLDCEDSNWTAADGPKEDLAKWIVDLLKSKAEMLDEYFSVEIDKAGNLLGLPMILEDYDPPLVNLPDLVLRLASNVDWSSEKECFESFCREMASFYAVPEISYDHKLENNEQKGNVHWKWTIEHVLYATIKSTLKPPNIFSTDSTILQIANLPDLYKVFERC